MKSFDIKVFRHVVSDEHIWRGADMNDASECTSSVLYGVSCYRASQEFDFSYNSAHSHWTFPMNGRLSLHWLWAGFKRFKNEWNTNIQSECFWGGLTDSDRRGSITLYIKTYQVSINLSTAPNDPPVNPSLPSGYVTKELNHIQSWYRVIVNPVTQRPNKSGISNQTSKFIKENKKKNTETLHKLYSDIHYNR